MLYYLSNFSPFAYLFLLGTVFLLRAPSFHSGYFAADESVYLLIGERLAEGGSMYLDAWDHKPPLIHWFYGSFVWLFGSGALTAIRIFTCFYVFFAALLLNGLLGYYRIVPNRSILPGFLYILAVSLPWYAQELNAELLMSVPMLLSFTLLLVNYVEDRRQWSNAFAIGALCAVCVGIKYQGAFHFAALLAAYILIAPFRVGQLVSIFTGFFSVIMLIVLILYFNKSLYQFWDLGFVFNFDYVRMKPLPGQTLSWYGFVEYLKLWGPMIFFAAFGFLAMRARSYGMSIKERKMEIAMTWWLILGAAVVVLGGGRFYLHYFIYVVPAIVFYLSDYFSKLKKTYQRVFSMMACLAYPTVLYLLYFICLNPAWYAQVKPYTTEGGWLQNVYYNLNGTQQEALLRQDIERVKPRNGILICHFLPELYLKLGQPCASKYVNFSMAYYKMNWLSANFRNPVLVSKPEELSDVYAAFEHEKPDYVIDPLGVFAEIQDKTPILLNDYTQYTVGNYPVYVRRAK